MPDAPSLTVQAPAKVNLTLEVLRPRPDGYHELRTLFQAIGRYDTLTFERAGDLSLAVEGDAPPADDNLVLRAARLLWNHAQSLHAPGAHIRLKKRIPSGAGLGGGSSDAAAALVALNQLWGAGLDREQLAALGRQLGADVPFFLWGGAALGTQRGDRIEPLPSMPPAWFVLATPPFELPAKTARIFRALRPDEHTDGARTLALAADLRRGVPLTSDRLYNGLFAAARREFAKLSEYVATLERASGGPWMLSGAGPTCYRLAGDEREAREIERRLEGLPGARFIAPALPPVPPASGAGGARDRDSADQKR